MKKTALLFLTGGWISASALGNAVHDGIRIGINATQSNTMGYAKKLQNTNELGETILSLIGNHEAE